MMRKYDENMIERTPEKQSTGITFYYCQQGSVVYHNLLKATPNDSGKADPNPHVLYITVLTNSVKTYLYLGKSEKRGQKKKNANYISKAEEINYEFPGNLCNVNI